MKILNFKGENKLLVKFMYQIVFYPKSNHIILKATH